jgi:uncharacterized membrane protein
MVVVLGSNILIFIGVFLIAEAIFSIIYYFKGSPLPHTFRAIRAVFGAFLIYRGATYSIYKTSGLLWSQVAFFVTVGLSILAGYEVAKVLERGKNKEKEEN